MVLELRRINTLQKVFMTLKRLRELTLRSGNKKYTKNSKSKTSNYNSKQIQQGRWKN